MDSQHVWIAPSSASNESYRIDGDNLYLLRDDASGNFVCRLKVDSELGGIDLELDLNKDLLEQAFQREDPSADITGDRDVQVGEDSDNACIPGENC